MLRNKLKNTLIPEQFLVRLTVVNILVIAVFVGLSSWAIYNTACMLADGLVSMSSQKQSQFEATLFQYLWIFSISMIIAGSLIHFYLTKKLIRPLKEVIDSTKQVKKGDYPKPIEVESNGEIGELIGHFNDLVKQLENNEKHRKKLVSDLSHEFRTPLSNLNGYLRALENGVVEGDPKLYYSLRQESQRLTHLVEQMEQLKEWDHVSSQTYLRKSPIDIAELVEQTVEMFRWKVTEAAIPLHIDVESSILHLNSDSMTQVISNLLDNAVRYYEGAGPIEIKGDKQQDRYQLSITAPGKPIPPDEQERIFERFHRVENSRSRASGGSGLGLAISKEIVDQHQGRIGVDSEGDVHTFWFCLP